MSDLPPAGALKMFAREMLPALEQEMRMVLAEPAASPSLHSESPVQALTPRKGKAAPHPFYGMMHYHMGWVDAALQPADVPNGKRIRPLLCLLTCQAAAERSAQVATRSGSYKFSGAQVATRSGSYKYSREHLTPEHPSFEDSGLASGQALTPEHLSTQTPFGSLRAGSEHLIAWHQALPAAAAIELLHNFSLIHDDIEDASPTRRGRPTLWKIWGVAQAINSGDAMFALAHLALGGLAGRGVKAEVVVRALRRFDETCLRLTRGQHADIAFERREEVTVAEYMEMITGKTAVLLALCAELGALVAGADDATIGHYAAFGRDLGLAFQVKDDILGIWGDEARIGKSAATDIATGKKTLPILYALSQSAPLRRLYRPPQAGKDSGELDQKEVVQQVVALLDETGARDFASAKASDYSQSALGHLEAASPTGPAGAALYELAHMLLNRDF